MELLKQRILRDGRVEGPEVLKVDTFLNHALDVELLDAMGQTFFDHFKGEKITKILTIESSGIAIACMTARHFGVPVVFAKKYDTLHQDPKSFESEVFSFTRQKSYKIRVARRLLQEGDRVLVLDDFLANGRAVLGLRDIASQAGAEIAGVGIAIEKGFQPGGALLKESGIEHYSLAVIDSMEDGKVNFR